MPLFRYDAIDLSGKGAQGVIDADSLSVAKEKLRKEQLFVTRLFPLQEKGKSFSLGKELLLSFTKEVGSLLRAGLPLYESLITIEEKYKRHKADPLFLDLCDHLKEGGQLSSVLKKYPSTFSPLYLAMVKVGEQSGDLARVFEKLAELIEREQKLKKQIMSAALYPAFLACFCFLVVGALLFFIVPSMQELFQGRSLHPVTACVLAVSKWAVAHQSLLITLLFTLLLSALFAIRSRPCHRFFYKLLLKTPLIKSLLLHTSLMRLCRAMEMLLSGGVPLLTSLQLARKVTGSPLLEQEIEEIERKILRGEKLSTACEKAPSFPKLVIRMLFLAEETGRMGETFLNLATIYDDEMEKHLSQLTSFLQPALLILLGGIVGLVVLSILLPLTDVSGILP